ncbi:MAG: DUF3536 domain-containing protein [Terracidiphilus sp.]
MEMQRHAQLMYTSCGWFFDDVAGIETVQVIAYAARVLQLAKQLFGQQAAPFEPAFLARLAEAHSNNPEEGNGARIYEKSVATMELNLEQVAAHYAISSIFSSFADETDLFCFHVRRISYEIHTSGRGRLALGRVHVASGITGDAQSFSFAALHFGDQNITAAVKVYSDAGAAEFEAFSAEAAVMCSAPTSLKSFARLTASTATQTTRSLRSSVMSSAASSRLFWAQLWATLRIRSPRSTGITPVSFTFSRKRACPNRPRSHSRPALRSTPDYAA